MESSQTLWPKSCRILPQTASKLSSTATTQQALAKPGLRHPEPGPLALSYGMQLAPTVRAMIIGTRQNHPAKNGVNILGTMVEKRIAPPQSRAIELPLWPFGVLDTARCDNPCPNSRILTAIADSRDPRFSPTKDNSCPKHASNSSKILVFIICSPFLANPPQGGQVSKNNSYFAIGEQLLYLQT